MKKIQNIKVNLLFCSLISAQCTHTTTLTDSSGTIYSPNYPFKYSNNIARCWRVYSYSSSYLIRLTSSSLNLESCSRCTCDFIEVFDGYSKSSKSLGKYCTRSFTLNSSASYLYIKFNSNSAVKGNSFSISYVRVAKG